MPTDKTAKPDELFELFVNAQTFKTILHSFDDLCRTLRIDRQNIGYGKRSLYKVLTSKLTSWKSKSLWSKIDKRGAQKEYENGNACADTKVKKFILQMFFSLKYLFIQNNHHLDLLRRDKSVSVRERFHLYI